MSIQSATPYLILNGQAEQAIPFYQSALGAVVETRQRFGEVDQSCPEARKDLTMHAELRLGRALLMLSDGPAAGATVSGGPVSVALDWDDPAAMRRAFDALASTGQVIQPIFDAPWGSLFGVVQDEFGISWMMNGSTKKA